MAKRKTRKQKQKYDLDIVIPIYGRADLLQKCLASVWDNIGDVKARTIIVDDQGPDQNELNKIYHSVNGPNRVVRNPQNSGFPKTVNTGISKGQSPLVLILNTDIELQPGAIQAMMAEFDDEKVGIVGAKLLFPPDSVDPHRPAGKVQHAGIAIDFRGQVVHANIGWSADHPKVNERRVMQAVTGACLMVRRTVLQQAHKAYRNAGDSTSGAFNEVYSPGCYEDIELCFAARSFDYQVIYQPKAVAYHHVGASVEQAPAKGYPLQRNELIFRARCGQLLAFDSWRFS